MTATNIEVTFHLVGGQSAVILMPLEEGASVNADILRECAKGWRDAGNLWLSQGTDWAITVPDMKNVAMIQFRPV